MSSSFKINMNMEKEFFMPGDLVTVKHDLPNKPVMIVVKKKTTTIKSDDNKSEFFQGIICR